MKSQRTRLASGGKTQSKSTPEPHQSDRYRDAQGQQVTVIGVVFNRVTFVRDGYPAECTYPLARFNAEFTYAGRAQA